MKSQSLETENIHVRRLRADDLDRVIALDARVTQRSRGEYFTKKLAQALSESGIEVSLAAELDGMFVGFLMVWVYYGEFGTPEPVAVLDTLAVHPDFQGQGVGAALLDQLLTNLHGLGIPRLQTEVSWEDQRLMSFFRHEGFRPAPRFCLDLEISHEELRRRQEARVSAP